MVGVAVSDDGCYLVANYFPAGNMCMPGEFRRNVPPVGGKVVKGHGHAHHNHSKPGHGHHRSGHGGGGHHKPRQHHGWSIEGDAAPVELERQNSMEEDLNRIERSSGKRVVSTSTNTSTSTSSGPGGTKKVITTVVTKKFSDGSTSTSTSTQTSFL